MGRAVLNKKCLRVGDVRKDVREIAEFYFDLDNKTNFTTYSVLCTINSIRRMYRSYSLFE